MTPTQVWQTPALDGQIWGQPLVYGSRGYVATENDSVYAQADADRFRLRMLPATRLVSIPRR